MNSYYESDAAVSEYLLFHYGAPDEVLPWDFGPAASINYPLRCVTECVDTSLLDEDARALDLGCAVGRSTFELARHCPTVVGIDFSQKFIDVAKRLQETGELEYGFKEEGDLAARTLAKVDPVIDRSRVTFIQGDAHDISPCAEAFDVILMANLIDRLADPHKCLMQLADYVNPGGQLVITTPCTWMEDCTSREKWLGGFTSEGKPVRTMQTLRETLEPEFQLSKTSDMPFLIREHSRKFQWSVAIATTWIRKL